MDIRKADSKGRVSGFEPGQVYAIDFDKGYLSRVVLPEAVIRSEEIVLSGETIRQIGKVMDTEILIN